MSVVQTHTNAEHVRMNRYRYTGQLVWTFLLYDSTLLYVQYDGSLQRTTGATSKIEHCAAGKTHGEIVMHDSSWYDSKADFPFRSIARCRCWIPSMSSPTMWLWKSPEQQDILSSKTVDAHCNMLWLPVFVEKVPDLDMVKYHTINFCQTLWCLGDSLTLLLPLLLILLLLDFYTRLVNNTAFTSSIMQCNQNWSSVRCVLGFSNATSS